MKVHEILYSTNKYPNQLITIEGFLVYDWNNKVLFMTATKNPITYEAIYFEMSNVSNDTFREPIEIMQRDEIRQIFLQEFENFPLSGLWWSWAALLYPFATSGLETALELFDKIGKEDLLADLHDRPEFTIRTIRTDFFNIYGTSHFAKWIENSLGTYKVAKARVSGYLKVNQAGKHILTSVEQVLLRRGDHFCIINKGENNLNLAEIGDYPKLKVRELYKQFDQFEGKVVRLEGYLVGREVYKQPKPPERLILTPNYHYRNIHNPKTGLHINPKDLKYFRSLFMPLFNRRRGLNHRISLAQRVQIVGTPIKISNKLELINIRSVANMEGWVQWASKEL